MKCSAARQMLVPKQHRNGENAETNVRKNARMCLIQTSFEKETTNMIGQKRIEIAEKNKGSQFLLDILLDIPTFQAVFNVVLG